MTFAKVAPKNPSMMVLPREVLSLPLFDYLMKCSEKK
jgi:hypothetical protein